jgi:hypothetical protein
MSANCGGHEIGDPVDHPTATNKPRSFTDLYMSPQDYINVVSQFMVNSPLEKLIGQLPTSIDTLPNLQHDFYKFHVTKVPA